jgi:hypothetical protein
VIFGEKKDGRAALKQLAGHAERVAKALVEDGVAKGELRRVDPRFLHIAIVGLCEAFVTLRPLVEELAGGKPAAQLLGGYRDFVVELLLQGLGQPDARAKRKLGFGQGILEETR